MNRLIKVQWIVLLLVTLALFAPVSAMSKEQRVALVIGNGAYMDSPLKNPVNDATDMASVLKDLGFEVTLETDANQRTIEESIREFGGKLRSGGVGMFYFAGHGIQHRGINYLIPVHANIKNEADVKYEAVDAGRVLAQMEDAGNGLNIIILDACRNNPFARSFRSADRGLARMDAPVGSLLAYATAPGNVAHDGDGRNGLYTSKLLAHLKTPGLKLEDFFKRVRQDVVIQSIELGTKQIPWESSSVMIDFYLASKKDEKDIKSQELYSASQIVNQLNSLNKKSEKSDPPRNMEPQLNIAILPFEINRRGQLSNFMVTDRIAKEIQRRPRLAIKYSYYELDSQYGTSITDKEINAFLDRYQIFKKDGFFSPSVPDLKLFKKLGEKLKVDYLLTYKFKAQDRRGDIEACDLLICYIFDVKNDLLYSKRMGKKSIYTGDFQIALPAFVKDLFEKIKKQKS